MKKLQIRRSRRTLSPELFKAQNKQRRAWRKVHRVSRALTRTMKKQRRLEASLHAQQSARFVPTGDAEADKRRQDKYNRDERAHRRATKRVQTLERNIRKVTDKAIAANVALSRVELYRGGTQ